MQVYTVTLTLAKAGFPHRLGPWARLDRVPLSLPRGPPVWGDQQQNQGQHLCRGLSGQLATCRAAPQACVPHDLASFSMPMVSAEFQDCVGQGRNRRLQ